MPDFSFPQTGDVPEFSYFGSLRGTGISGIINGFEFTADFSVPEVTVAEGKALINRPQTTTTHPQITPADNPTDVAIVCELDQKTASLTNSDINHVFVQANVNADDAPQIVANTTGDKPAPASVKIGEINTSVDTVSEGWNRIVGAGGLSFPDERAARREAAQLRLQPGTIAFDRDLNTQLFVPAADPSEVRTLATPTGDVIAFDLIQK
jgi:hypothetical protein